MERSAQARWCRVVLRYRDHVVRDLRFEPDAQITIGEGDAAVIVPGLAPAVLAENGRIHALPGLRLRNIDSQGAHELGLVDLPDVALCVHYDSGPRPDFDANPWVPWRELLYGFACVGFIASLLLAFEMLSAIDTGGPGAVETRMQRAMLEVDRSVPTVAHFSMPPAVQHRPSTALRTEASHSDPAPPSVELEPEAEPPEPSPSHTVEVLELPESAAKKAEPETSAAKPATKGRHSHTAQGAPESGGDDGLAVAAAPTCDDPQRDPKPNVDVVFVIDVSTTMAFALDHLTDEIAALDEAVRRHDPNRRYGLVLFVDDVLVVDGNPYTDVGLLRRDFASWSRFTSSNRQLRSADKNLDWPENGLDALMAATESFDWRDADDTLRLVVYASDDDFGETGDIQSGQRVHHGYTETVSALRRASIRVASFTAPIGGKCECEDVRAGFMTPYKGHDPIPVATGGAAFDIDEVASERLHFDRALAGLIDNLVCKD